MTTATIDIDDLHKSFGRTVALNGLTLRVAPGEVHGFLGPNGAGKTTTLRILLGLVRADAGTASVLGMNPWNDIEALHRRLVYVPGDVSLWPNLTGGQVIDLLGRMRGDLDEHRRTQLIERFDLDPRKRSRSYSKGNRQKVALVAALSSHAELLLLDEPTSGLDPLMEATFREVVQEVKNEGRTVLLSSHILSEVEALADRVSIIRAGKVVETGTLGELRHLHTTKVEVTLRTMPAQLVELDGVTRLSVYGDKATFHVASEHLDAAIAVLSEAGIVSLTCEPPTLEELFLSQYTSASSEA